MTKVIYFLGVALCFSGCSHALHLTNISELEAHGTSKKGSLISSEGEQFVVLGFTTQTNFANQAYHNLEKQCLGEITGVQTRYSTSHGFLSWTNKIKMTAWCH